MSRTNLLTKFKHLNVSERNKKVVDPVLALSERLQEVPQFIDRVFLNLECLMRSKPLEFSQPDFTDSSKVQELASIIHGMSERLQIIINCSTCLTATAKEALRHGCIYARGQMRELISGIKALEELPGTLESIRSNLLSCERDIQNIRTEAFRAARLFFSVADSNLAVVRSDRAILGV